MTLRLSLVFVLSYLFLGASHAQTLDFEPLTLRDGLPATECYHTIQDTKGYIWVFTEYGIVKHNGDRFVPVCTNIPLKDQNAYAVFQKKNGEIYFANSYCKIFKIRNDSAFSIDAIEQYTAKTNGATDIIFQIAVDSSENIYFTNYNGSFFYSAATKNVRPLELPHIEGVGQLSYRQIEGTFFSARSAKFDKIHDISIEINDNSKKLKTKIPFDSFYELNQLRKVKNFYVLATSNTIYKIDDKGDHRSNHIDWIINIFTDQQDRIWALTKDGLLLLDNDLSVSATFLKGKIVSSVCFDDKGGIWATTIGEGVFHCKNKDEVAFLNNDLKQKEIFSLEKGPDNLYLSTIDGLCYGLDAAKNLSLLHHFENIDYCGSTVSYEGGHLFATKNGIFHKDSQGSLKELKAADKSSLYANFVTALNNSGFLAFGGTGVYYFLNDSLQHSSKLKTKLYCFTRTDPTHFMIGTKKGIYLYDYPRNELIIYHDFFADKSIMCLKYDPAGNLWVGTRGDGLFIVTGKKEIVEVPDLPFFVIKDVDFFGRNGLVVSTNTGVYTNTFQDTATTGKWINVFDSEVNGSEVFDNTLWIAARKGLYSMELNRLTTADRYPIIISSVYSNSKRVLNGTSDLAYHQNDLRFNIDFLNYRSKVKNFFFKLEGPVVLSGTINGTVLQVQNLEPGFYSLTIFPYDGPTYNEKLFVSTSFTIHPAYWQTNWFKILVLILIVLISASFVAIYYTFKRRQGEKEAEFNKLLAEYKLTALKAQINPHFISNSLSAIQLLIDCGKVDKANQYIAKFSLLIRYVLKYSDKSVSKLSDELKVIELNVELEQLRFENSFSFEMLVDPDLNPSELFIPPLITQPFIENAIWHGLLPLKAERLPKLTLEIAGTKDSIVISIIDNGVGRSQTAGLNQIGNNSHKESKGSILIQNRIDNLNKMYNTDSASVKILDLYDDHSNPVGTRVDILLPVFLLDKLSEKQNESTARR